MKEVFKCLQFKTGECGGCPILAIALEKRSTVPRSEESALLERINKDSCGTDTNILIEPRRESPIWQV